MKTLTGNKALEKLIQIAFTRNQDYSCETCGGAEFTFIHNYKTTKDGQKLVGFTTKCDKCSNHVKYEFEKKDYTAN